MISSCLDPPRRSLAARMIERRWAVDRISVPRLPQAWSTASRSFRESGGEEPSMASSRPWGADV